MKHVFLNPTSNTCGILSTSLSLILFFSFSVCLSLLLLMMSLKWKEVQQQQVQTGSAFQFCDTTHYLRNQQLRKKGDVMGKGSKRSPASMIISAVHSMKPHTKSKTRTLKHEKGNNPLPRFPPPPSPNAKPHHYHHHPHLWKMGHRKRQFLNEMKLRARSGYLIFVLSG